MSLAPERTVLLARLAHSPALAACCRRPINVITRALRSSNEEARVKAESRHERRIGVSSHRPSSAISPEIIDEK